MTSNVYVMKESLCKIADSRSKGLRLEYDGRMNELVRIFGFICIDAQNSVRLTCYSPHIDWQKRIEIRIDIQQLVLSLVLGLVDR